MAQGAATLNHVMLLRSNRISRLKRGVETCKIEPPQPEISDLSQSEDFTTNGENCNKESLLLFCLLSGFSMFIGLIWLLVLFFRQFSKFEGFFCVLY